MLSKSKTIKLKKELSELGVTINQLADDKTVGLGRNKLILLLSGRTYDGAALKRIIEIRNEKKAEAVALLNQI